ncbi:MAG: DUF2079 domain-containing protein [Thermoplasmata archaeon]|jgi:uncharacterized membrane protein
MTQGRIWQRPLFWLTLMVIAFFGVSLYAGVVAYYNFHTHNSTDAGIITQAVASTTFGHQAPFYESYDCMVKGRCSFLLVHPGIVLYMAAPFYAIAPSTITLFALRSFFVAAAAFPLYWLTRQVTKSQVQGLLAGGIYLVWAPTLAGDAFSLHLESLMPVELLGLAALWQAGRYRWGLLAALTAFLTFEIAPVFVFLIGVFFALPYVERWISGLWKRFRGKGRPGPSTRTPKIDWKSWFRNRWKIRELRYILLLLASSVVAYVVLYSFTNVWGAWILGVTPPSVPAGIDGFFYDSSTPPAHTLTIIFHSAQTWYTAQYWLILYGLLAFIPLLSPRSLVISVPWIGWTFLTDSSRFTSIGSQYTMVAAGPIFIGLAYGFGRIPFTGVRSAFSRRNSTGSSSPRSTSAIPRRSRLRSRAVSSVVVTALTVVVVANVLFSPIDPVLSTLGYHPTAPFDTGYFDNPLTITPGLVWAEELISNVPREASIVASSALFPLVANYPYAFVLEPGAQPFADPQNTGRLPFNLTDGPDFVFIQLNQIKTIANAFAQNLSNSGRFGLRGYVGSTAIGPLFLYEQHYTSTAEGYGPSSFVQLNASYWPRNGLTAGPMGRYGTNATAPEGTWIHSLRGSNNSGEVWTGPDAFLTPGNYALRFEVMADGMGLRKDPQMPVLDVVVGGFGITLLNESFSASDFVSGEWTNLTVSITSADPVPDVNCQGFVLDTNVSVGVAYLAVSPEDLGQS